MDRARLAFAALACLLLPILAAAQIPLPSAPVVQTQSSTGQLSLPSGPLAQSRSGLGSASLPDRSELVPIPPARRELFVPHRRTFAPRFDRRLPPPLLSYGAGYVPMGPWTSSEIAPEGRPEEHGYLRLDLQPGTAQVTVDGEYVGTVDDFRRLVPGRSLEAGTHRLELRAPAYDSAAFDVRIFPNETTTYGSDLAKAVPSVDRAGPATRAVPKTFYVIAGCYAGDKPPQRGRVPATCDVGRVRIVPPVVQRVAGHRDASARTSAPRD